MYPTFSRGSRRPWTLGGAFIHTHHLLVLNLKVTYIVCKSIIVIIVIINFYDDVLSLPKYFLTTLESPE